MQNTNDRYAVAVKDNGMITGHLLRKVSCLRSLFLRRGGRITYTVTSTKRYSADLSQGGLEISCLLLLYDAADQKELDNLKALLK